MILDRDFSPRASSKDPWCLLRYVPEQTVEQSVDLPWRHDVVVASGDTNQMDARKPTQAKFIEVTSVFERHICIIQFNPCHAVFHLRNKLYLYFLLLLISAMAQIGEIRVQGR